MCRLVFMITLSLALLFIPSQLEINALHNPTLTLEAPNLLPLMIKNLKIRLFELKILDAIRVPIVKFKKIIFIVT